MPASPGVQRAAARVCGSAVLACTLVVLGAWHAAQPHADRAQSAALPKAGLAQLLEASSASAGAGRGGRVPVLSSLLETQLAETCDCSKPQKCEEIIKTDLKQKLPGGGAGGLSKEDWGAWDPVTGVPRIGCPDTVTHGHCKPRSACARLLLCTGLLCTGLRAPWCGGSVSECRATRGCLSGRRRVQARRRVVQNTHQPLLWLDDVCADGYRAVAEWLQA